MWSARRLQEKTGLWQTVGDWRVLLKGVTRAVPWQTHISAKAFQQVVKEGVKGLGQGDLGHRAIWSGDLSLKPALFAKPMPYTRMGTL